MSSYESIEDPRFSFPKNEKNPFALPLDYFKLFENKLAVKLEMEKELQEFPILTSLQKNNVFKTPADYFHEKEIAGEYRLELDAYPTLKTIRKSLQQETLNDAYQEELSTALAHRIEVTDELKIYKSLYALDKKPAFSLPADYFEFLASRVRDLIYTYQNQRKSLLDTILDFVFVRKMAVSLGLMVLILIPLYLKYSGNSIKQENCQTLACLEKQEILNSQALTNFNEDQLMDLVNVNALYNQLHQEIKADTLHPEEYILDNLNTNELLENL